MLTGFDYAVLLIIGLSALLGLWRGLVAEIFSLIGWVAAFIIAWHYADMVAPHLPSNWPGGAKTQWLLAFAVLVVVVMITGAILSALLSRLTHTVGLGSLDRSLGTLFGMARGVLLVLVLFMLAKLTDLPKQPFWRKAVLRPYVEKGVTVLEPLFPSAISERLPAAAKKEVLDSGKRLDAAKRALQQL